MTLDPTPGQTVGPFFGFALPRDGGEHVVAPGRSNAIRLRGRVYDGQGDPVPDALLEIWQAEGFGRAATDDDGQYSFTTLRPDGPFIAMTVFARGLLDRLFTRVYLTDDPFLATLPDDRGSTLLASAEEDGYVFDVHLQGDDETVFLDFTGA